MFASVLTPAELPCVAYSSSNSMNNRGSRHRFERTLPMRFSLASTSYTPTSPSAPLLQSVIDSDGNRTNAGPSSTGHSPATQSIVDMCSGGGGPWLDLARQLRCGDADGDSAGLQVWLTDKYPNLEAFQSVSASSDHHITFYPEPVDAMNSSRFTKRLANDVHVVPSFSARGCSRHPAKCRRCRRKHRHL